MEKQINCQACPTLPNMLKTIDDYGPAALGPPLGEGAYGTVRKHVSAKHGAVAVKTMLMPFINGELSGDVLREITSLTALQGHPNILQMLAWTVPDYRSDIPSDVNLVLELGLTSLSDAIKQHKIDPQRDTKSIMYQLLSAVAYMQSEDIWHRDIKPGNIIVMKYGPNIEVKLGDFGLARAGPFCNMSPTQVMYTLWYRPPEILIRQIFGKHDLVDTVNYDSNADVWACGITMWDILTGMSDSFTRNQMRGMTEIEQTYKIFSALGWPATPEKTPFGWTPQRLRDRLTAKYYPIKTIPVSVSPLRKLIKTNDLEWDLLSKLLECNAKSRISVFLALQHPYFDDVRTKPISKRDCYVDLLKKQVNRRGSKEEALDCVQYLPGENYNEKFVNYIKASTLMLSFIANSTMVSDVGTFGLAVELLHCALSTGKFKVKTLHVLSTLALCCSTLAGKYHARYPASLMAAIAALGATFSPLDMAQFEAEMFQTIGGNLNLPTAYRMLIELVGCPSPTSTRLHKSLFAWSVIFLYTIETTRASFIGNPSDIAQLALAIASHYHNVKDLSVVPGCGKRHPMTPKALQEGAAIVHSELSHYNQLCRTQLVSALNAIMKQLIPNATPVLTFDGLNAIFTGNVVIDSESVSVSPVTDSEETEDEERRKRVTRKRVTATDLESTATLPPIIPYKKPQMRLLSPDLLF
jgi:serine/threonine protein kinase